MSLLEEISQQLTKMPAQKQADLVKEALAATQARVWVPNPGPQTDAMRTLADETFYGGSAGCGKRLCDDTIVPVPIDTDPSGYKRHGDLRPGDFVYSPSGHPVPVLYVHDPVDDTDAYELEFSTGEKIVADGDHRWLTWSEAERLRFLKSSGEWRAKRRAKRPSRALAVSKKPWVSALLAQRNKERQHDVQMPRGSVRTTREIASTVNASRGRARVEHSIDLTKPLQAQDAPLPLDPYWFGLWLGDGYSRCQTIGMLSDDWSDITVEQHASVSYDSRPPRVRVFESRRWPLAYLQALRALGVIGGKHIPAIYLRGSHAQRLALLQGLMDTDGSCQVSGTCEVGSSDRRLAEDIAELVSSLGLKCSLKTKSTKCQTGPWRPHHRITFKTDVPVFRLPRKAERQRRAERISTDRRYIVACRRVPSVRMRCITVANPDGLYLLGRSFIATHNSGLIVGLSLTEHQRSLLMRRTNKEATGFADEIEKILGSRDGWNSQSSTWRTADGRVIDIGGCEHEDDKQKRKGNPHDLICVGRGTRVLMADLSYRPVEDLRGGDMLMTLEGPRLLERVYPPQIKDAVIVTVTGVDGQCAASQVQSKKHELLTRSGVWASYSSILSAGPCGPQICSPPIESHALDKSAAAVRRKSRVAPQLASLCSEYLRRGARLARAILGRTHQQVSAASGEQPPRESASAGTCGLFQENRPPALSSGHPARREPSPGSGASSLARRALACAAFCEMTASSLLDSLVGYLSDLRRGDAHIRARLRPGEVACQLWLHQPAGAGPPSPTRSAGGAPARIHRRTRRIKQYAHPYTLEKRPAAPDTSVSSAYCTVSPAGPRELFDLQVESARHYITDGGFINKNCFDEVSDFTETMYTFISGWNRSTNSNQRCRIIACGNPPTRPEGLWVIKRWAAWLDPNHPRPAKPVEIRWYTTIDGRDTEVDGPGPHLVDGQMVRAMSRTFIPGKLSDNPDLADTNYAAHLAALPVELRSAYRDGNFNVVMQDEPMQVIPSAWVSAAIKRWRPEGGEGIAMSAMAHDPAGGGKDPAGLCWRHGGWFAPFLTRIDETANGSAMAAWIVTNRRDSAPVVIDVGGGYGGAVMVRLEDNDIVAHKFNGAEGSTSVSRDGKLRFANRRAEAAWKFREELDPDQPGGSIVALPDDPEMKAQLAALRWRLTAKGILIDSKDDVRSLLGGASPTKGDLVVMCLSEGHRAAEKSRAIRRTGGPGTEQGGRARHSFPKTVLHKPR